MPDQEKQKQQAALSWIVCEAKRHHLPYQVVGGLAALAHGGSRPLHDIDLYMPFGNPNWEKFLESTGEYVVWGPETIIDGQWDLTYLKINYHGQKIEIGDSADLRIQNYKTGEWIEQAIDYESSVSKSVLGCQIDVMPLGQLMAYKAILGRDVDQQDIRDMTLVRS
ncbi:hypothetical protein J4E08_22905 [Sagittula sp. NFXS13]|uniref:hypothetical protein n=1 Tax=Sagittula sp. NFXS13 TaxID=2819095 RepID=UPI0032DF6008